MLNTAFDDELIRRNPCRIKGAGVEHPAERPVATLEQVMVLADAIDPRYRLRGAVGRVCLAAVGRAGGSTQDRL